MYTASLSKNISFTCTGTYMYKYIYVHTSYLYLVLCTSTYIPVHSSPSASTYKYIVRCT